MRTENNIVDSRNLKNKFNGIDKEQSLLNVLPVAIYTCDDNGRITYYNDAAAQLWGRKAKIGIDMWCGAWKIYHADGSLLDLNRYPTALLLRERISVRVFRIIIEKPNGARVDVLAKVKPIFNTSGKIIGAINMLIDLSEDIEKDNFLADDKIKYKKLSEFLELKVYKQILNLRKSEERFNKMIEEVQDYAILLLDRQGNILNWNKGAENINGYIEKEVLGRNFNIFYHIQDRENNLPEKLIAEASDTGRATHQGWRIKKNGEKYWGQIVITALRDREQNVIGFSKVTRDLTERKLAETQAREFTRDIEFRNKQLEEYAHIASHDLQEPLRKIQTFAELLEKNLADKKKVFYYLGKITASAKRMTTLIKDVLQYSQLSLNDNLFILTDLNQILDNVKEDFELLISEKQAKIMHDKIPLIKCIPVQLHQLFSNLLGNSLKFSKENLLIEINAQKATVEEIKQFSQLSSMDNYIKITFKDNGIGFESIYSTQIFKLFQRLHITKSETGTGIGLSLCKKIIENHKGHIDVSTEPNIGTTFSIFLPL